MPHFLSRLPKRKKIPLLLILLVAALGAFFYVTGFPVTEEQRFDRFTREVFCQELSGNTLSQHYTVAQPDTFGLEDSEPSLGDASLKSRMLACASCENYLSALAQFDYEKLSAAQQLTFDIFQKYLDTELSAAAYLLYDEPLSPTLGIQAQLPILLAEYTFRTKGDIEDYLALLTRVPDYFNSILSFERDKSSAGLFMSDTNAREVLSQCRDFIKNPDENYLLQIFDEKIDAVSNLTVDEKIAYKERSQKALLGYVIPAYESLIDGVTQLMGTGKNEMGLFYFPQGTRYYEYLVKSVVGDDRSIAEIEEEVKQQMVADFTAVRELSLPRTQSGADGASGGTNSQTEVSGTSGQTSAGNDVATQRSDSQTVVSETPGQAFVGNSAASPLSGGQIMNFDASSQASAGNSAAPQLSGKELTNFEISSQTSAGNSAAAQPSFGNEDPVGMLKDLREKIAQDFPAAPAVSCEVKYVHDSLKDYLSPAFYLTPAIDSYKDNVIYINPAGNYSGLELYTTLAHEGYPGHLYQSVTFQAANPDPLRCILDTGGYIEGWATYVEMYSYSLWPRDQTQAAISQHNRSFTLGLASLLDIGIHYRGYSLEDVSAFLEKLGFDATTAASLYKSILQSPANYLQYYVGYLNFRDLRDDVKTRLGDRFSLREFHNAVLQTGPAPFGILQKNVYRLLGIAQTP